MNEKLGPGYECNVYAAICLAPFSGTFLHVSLRQDIKKPTQGSIGAIRVLADFNVYIPSKNDIELQHQQRIFQNNVLLLNGSWKQGQT